MRRPTRSCALFADISKIGRLLMSRALDRGPGANIFSTRGRSANFREAVVRCAAKTLQYGLEADVRCGVTERQLWGPFVRVNCTGRRRVSMAPCSGRKKRSKRSSPDARDCHPPKKPRLGAAFLVFAMGLQDRFSVQKRLRGLMRFQRSRRTVRHDFHLFCFDSKRRLDAVRTVRVCLGCPQSDAIRLISRLTNCKMSWGARKWGAPTVFFQHNLFRAAC